MKVEERMIVFLKKDRVVEGPLVEGELFDGFTNGKTVGRLAAKDTVDKILEVK